MAKKKSKDDDKLLYSPSELSHYEQIEKREKLKQKSLKN